MSQRQAFEQVLREEEAAHRLSFHYRPDVSRAECVMALCAAIQRPRLEDITRAIDKFRQQRTYQLQDIAWDECWKPLTNAIHALYDPQPQTWCEHLKYRQNGDEWQWMLFQREDESVQLIGCVYPSCRKCPICNTPRPERQE